MAGVKGRSGRKKTPLAELVRRGSRLDRRKREPGAIVDTFIAPSAMSRYTKAFYDTYLPILQDQGFVSVTDSIAFERMAKTYARICALEKLLGDTDSTENLFVEEDTKFGTVTRISAAARLLKELEPQLWSMMREFGLTPSSRGGITKIETAQDETDKLT